MNAQSDCTPSRPIRDGLFQTNPPRLIGSACRNCGARAFPAREFCPACDSDQVDSDMALAPTGRLYSFTTVRQAPPGRSTPYNLGYVDLDDHVRVMAQVECDPDALQIGMAVRLNLRAVGRQDGVDLIGYSFVPDNGKQEDAR